MAYTQADLDKLDTTIKSWADNPDIKKKTVDLDNGGQQTFFSIEELTDFRDWLKKVFKEESKIDLDAPADPSPYGPISFQRCN